MRELFTRGIGRDGMAKPLITRAPVERVRWAAGARAAAAGGGRRLPVHAPTACAVWSAATCCAWRNQHSRTADPSLLSTQFQRTHNINIHNHASVIRLSRWTPPPTPTASGRVCPVRARPPLAASSASPPRSRCAGGGTAVRSVFWWQGDLPVVSTPTGCRRRAARDAELEPLPHPRKDQSPQPRPHLYILHMQTRPSPWCSARCATSTPASRCRRSALGRCC